MRASKLIQLVSLILGAALVLGACGSADQDGADKTDDATAASTTLPVGDVEVPEGLTLTPAGEKLALGEPALIAYQANENRHSVLEVKVNKIKKGKIRDFSSFELDDNTRNSTPYYVNVKVKNVGVGNLGKAPIPLWAVDGNNMLIQASSFTVDFPTCASRPLPKNFPPEKTFSTCLAYLVPDKGSVTAVAYRPTQEYASITWEAPTKGAEKPDGSGNKKQK